MLLCLFSRMLVGFTGLVCGFVLITGVVCCLNFGCFVFVLTVLLYIWLRVEFPCDLLVL